MFCQIFFFEPRLYQWAVPLDFCPDLSDDTSCTPLGFHGRELYLLLLFLPGGELYLLLLNRCFRLYVLRGSRGDPLFMVVIIGASSLNLALEDWASVGGNEELQEDVIHYKGVTFHPKSKANKVVRNFLRDETNRNESVIIWHDVINNSTSEHPFIPRTPLTANQLVSEIKPLINSHPRIEAIVFCQRDGAPYILEDLKKLPIPVVQVTTDIISNSKQQDKDLLEGYRELHHKTALEIKT